MPEPEKIPNSAMPFSGGMGGPTLPPQLPNPMSPVKPVDVSTMLKGSIDRVNSMLDQAGSGTVTRAALTGALGLVDNLGKVQHNNQMQPLEEAKVGGVLAGTESDILNKTKVTDAAIKTLKRDGSGSGAALGINNDSPLYGLWEKFVAGSKK